MILMIKLTKRSKAIFGKSQIWLVNCARKLKMCGSSPAASYDLSAAIKCTSTCKACQSGGDE